MTDTSARQTDGKGVFLLYKICGGKMLLKQKNPV